jgi:hypothetical protein
MSASIREPVLPQHRSDVLHRLARFRFHAAGNQLRLARNIPERSGEIENIPDAHGLAERQLRGLRRRRIDEFHGMLRSVRLEAVMVRHWLI